MKKLKAVPYLCIRGEQALEGFSPDAAVIQDPVGLIQAWNGQNADEILVFDLSGTDEEHEAAILLLRRIAQVSECPVLAGGNIRRAEDVKKILYAGCAAAVLNFETGDGEAVKLPEAAADSAGLRPGAVRENGPALIEEVSRRFGAEKIGVRVCSPSQLTDHAGLITKYAGRIIWMGETAPEISLSLPLTWVIPSGEWASLPADIPRKDSLTDAWARFFDRIAGTDITGISGPVFAADASFTGRFRQLASLAGFDTDALKSAMDFSDFKTDAAGLVPVVVQDYQTDEVLMVAYMDREAYENTLRTGRMTYYSRSRQEQWIKGLTSGHFQYVKELAVDCDRDTLLAKVDQIGAACHTGNRSCFYTTLAKKEYNPANPLRVFQDVYDVILDRKAHPKEGSYTNYLFDKGIDKILKKVGEEATEIVIAAKNPDKEEIKYEISDFLYHVMVLMAEKGLTWEEVTRELARR